MHEAAGKLVGLSDREREILGLIAEGLSDVEIAERVSLTPEDVERHVEQILFKLDVRDGHASHRRVAAVLAYLRATLR